MSKPATRHKNKRYRPDENDGSSLEILRKIYSTGEISEDDILKLYYISKPVCQGCRVNSKDSPNCFCGLIPARDGVRRSGLWQRMSDVVLALGPDPCRDRSANSPAGLTNLGATCYVNGIVQCLYMNAPFRRGIFSIEPDLLKQHPVLNQLARLFAQLHSSKIAFIDSAEFIKTLELDNGVQQDSHEFLTLFLSLLECSLNRSIVPKARTVVQDLFRGKVSHVTRCSVCGKNSEASSNTEDFYELELNIKGLNNLEDSLEDYFSIEELHGGNQYFCESCGKRVDATRCIKLRSLPHVLSFQLKRCVFLPKTATKKKITSIFSFPRQLNMTKRLCYYSQSELIYDLSAILIHKGTAVDSGHYVAHIKDEVSGHWWEFDDETVSDLGVHPFPGGSSSSSRSDPLMKPPSCEEKVSVVNGNHNTTAQHFSSNLSITSCEEMFSSADAYMLMYNLRHSKENGAEDMDLGGKLVVSNKKDALPFHLLKEVEELNTSYIAACQDYQMKKDREIDRISICRQEVRALLSQAPVHSLEEPYFWISTDWLCQWADTANPLPINNTSIQCVHGKVPISKVGMMKRVSSKAWSEMHKKYRGGPELTRDDYCIECLKDGAITTISVDNYKDCRASMKELAEAVLAGDCLDGNLYFVSRAWLLQWLRRKNVDSPCDADTGPTASLRCPHGQLLPEQAPGTKRLLVPANLWLFLCETSKVGKPGDLLGCSPFPSDSETCATCSTEAFLKDDRRAAKIKQRQNHEKLFLGKSIALSPGSSYYLLPSSWLSNWRTFLAASAKNVSATVEPESLVDVLDSLKCCKHSRLLQRPPSLTWKRGVIVQKAYATDSLTIITDNDWKSFCEEWDVPPGKAVHAEVYYTSASTNKLTGSCEEMPILESDLDLSIDEVNAELECRQPFVKTNPEICEDCIGEKESIMLVQKLNYCNEDIRVFLVRGKEAPRSVLEASITPAERDRRTSKRSRRTLSGNFINLKVSGTTSIYQLKMMIWESFGVVKENQKLHKGSSEIGGESATLADMNIFPGDVLWVTESEVHENRDIADELAAQKMDLQEAEEGFRGTLLTSSLMPQE